MDPENRVRRRSVIAVIVLLAASNACSRSKRAEPRSNAETKSTAEQAIENPAIVFGFEDGADEVPAGFVAAETNGRGTPGAWRVEKTAQAPEGEKVVTLFAPTNAGERFNLLLSNDVHPADLVLGVQIKANAGQEDQGGGLVFRAQDAQNYYVARWNPLEHGIVVFRTENGERAELASSTFDADSKLWHTLEVRMKGGRGEVRFDGGEPLGFFDTAFRNAGKVGLWTKADAASSFDRLSVQF